MAVFLGHEQDVVPDHQAPADVRMAGVVGLAVANPGLLDDEAPAVVGVREIVERRPVRLKEHEFMVEPSGGRELNPQRQLPLEHVKRPASKHNFAIVTSLRPILVAAEDASPDDPDFPFPQVAIADLQGDLFRLPQARKEPELLVVAMRRAEFCVRLGDDAFAFLDREGIDGQAIFLRDAQGFQTGGGVVSLGVIPVPEVERAAHGAGDVVVGLFVPRMARHNAGQSRVADFLERFRADLWPPYGVEDSLVAVEGGKGHVVHGDAHFAVGQVSVKDLIASQAGSLGVLRL